MAFYLLHNYMDFIQLVCVLICVIENIDKKTIIGFDFDDCFLYFVKILSLDFMVTFYFCLQTAW